MALRTPTIFTAMILALPVALAQEKKAQPDDRKAQLDAIIKDFVQARNDAGKALRSAKTDQERKAAEDKMPKEKDFLPRVLKLIAGDVADDAAGEALAFAVFGLDTNDQRVFAALSKNFVKTPKIERFVQMSVSGAPASAKPVLEKVLADNPDKNLKGMACYALGNMAFEQEGEMPAKEALAYFNRVEKEFADVKLPGAGTLGEMAKGNLFELKNLGVGMKAPAATSKTLKGDSTSLAEHAGKVVVLDIWATWCGPCRQMIPHEREMFEKLRDKPFVLISLSADDEKKELETFLEKEKMPWIHWWDNGSNSTIIKQWNVRFFPTVYVIDSKGVIRHKGLRGKELEEAVEKLIAEVPVPPKKK